MALVIIHQLFSNELIHSSSLILRRQISGIVLEKLSFQNVSTNNLLSQKWKKWTRFFTKSGKCHDTYNMWILSSHRYLIHLFITAFIFIYLTKKCHRAHAISQVWEAVNTIFCYVCTYFSGQRKWYTMMEMMFINFVYTMMEMMFINFVLMKSK